METVSLWLVIAMLTYAAYDIIKSCLRVKMIKSMTAKIQLQIGECEIELEDYIRCPYCQKRYYSQGCSRETVHTCSFCGKSFSRELMIAVYRFNEKELKNGTHSHRSH